MPREIVLTSCNVFKAGNGQEYGLVSIDDSSQVVVFIKRGSAWIGHLEFDDHSSTGLAPGEARPEIAEAFDSLATVVVGPDTP